MSVYPYSVDVGPAYVLCRFTRIQSIPGMPVRLCRSTQTRSPTSQRLQQHLAPTRGLPPDISPRSWRGSAASDEGPRQVYPKNPVSLADHRHNRCRRYSYVGKHFVFQLDVSLHVGSFHLAGKTARLVRVIGFSTWQSISACRLGSCARRDVPLARTPPTSCRSPRRPCMRKHLIAV